MRPLILVKIFHSNALASALKFRDMAPFQINGSWSDDAVVYVCCNKAWNPEVNTIFRWKGNNLAFWQISFIWINGVKFWNQPGSSKQPPPTITTTHSHCVNPTRPPSTQINYAEMNLTHKFLLWPPLRICEHRAALKRDSWPDLCMALGWPPAGGRGTWLGGTRSEMWKSCRRRHTGACEEFRCIPCCTPYPDPPAGTAEVRKQEISRENIC